MVVEAGTGAGVALVTGASGVVGRAVSAKLMANGWRVAGVDGTDAVCDLPLTVDVRSRADLIGAAGRVRAELGPIDLLVTAASVHYAAPIGELPGDKWRSMLEVNLGGTVNACAAVVPSMIDASHGAVVTTTSWHAVSGAPGDAYYAASRGAVIAFTKSFSLEVAKSGVRVNCVVVEPVGGDSPDAGMTGAEPSGPASRDAAADSVASTVLYLAQDGDFYVGQLFTPVAVGGVRP